MSSIDGPGSRGPAYRTPSTAPARAAAARRVLPKGDGPPLLSRLTVRVMAANCGLEYLWKALSTPGRATVDRQLRSAWSEQPPPSAPRPRQVAGPGVVPPGLQAFLGRAPQEPKSKPQPMGTGWKVDLSQPGVFRPQGTGPNPAPPRFGQRPAEPKTAAHPSGPAPARARPPAQEVPVQATPQKRSTERLNQLLENSKRHLDRMLARQTSAVPRPQPVAGPGETATHRPHPAESQPPLPLPRARLRELAQQAGNAPMQAATNLSKAAHSHPRPGPATEPVPMATPKGSETPSVAVPEKPGTAASSERVQVASAPSVASFGSRSEAREADLPEGSAHRKPESAPRVPSEGAIEAPARAPVESRPATAAPTPAGRPPGEPARRDPANVEVAARSTREIVAALEERALRTRPGELTLVPGQVRRETPQERQRQSVRESEKGRHQRDQGREDQRKQRDQESRLERRQGREGPPQSEARAREARSPQQAARTLTLARENHQLALRRLESLGTGRVAEGVAQRHAVGAIGSLLKKAYREQELQELDEDSAVNALGVLLKLAGDFTYAHCARVLELALSLADEVGVQEPQVRQQVRHGALFKDLGVAGQIYAGQSEETLDRLGALLSSQDLRRAGLLHDIGKLRIPADILARQGQLSPDEYQVMRLHPIYGEEIVAPIASLRHLCPVIRGHHERWDGKGYPDGLRAEQIPLPARIIAIADVFDALHSERPGKAAMEPGRAWQIVAQGSGTHFDPWLVGAFARVLVRCYPDVSFALPSA